MADWRVVGCRRLSRCHVSILCVLCVCARAFCSMYYLKDTCAYVAHTCPVYVPDGSSGRARLLTRSKGQAHACVVTWSMRRVAGSTLDSLKPRAPTAAADAAGEEASNSKRGAHSNASSSPMKPASSASVPLNASAAGPPDSLDGREVTVFTSFAGVCALVCVRACAPRERCRSQTPRQIRRSMF